MKRHPHELYNTQTEKVEAVEMMTSQEATERNEQLYFNEEPRRWMAVAKPKTRRISEIVDRPELPTEPDGNILFLPTRN